MNHSTVNSRTAEKRARSAKAPTISAQVMPANVAWKATKLSSGTVPDKAKVPVAGSNMPPRNTLLKPPKNALPSVNASE